MKLDKVSAYHGDLTYHWLGENVEKLGNSASSSVHHFTVHHFTVHHFTVHHFAVHRLSVTAVTLLPQTP